MEEAGPAVAPYPCFNSTYVCHIGVVVQSRKHGTICRHYVYFRAARARTIDFLSTRQITTYRWQCCPEPATACLHFLGGTVPTPDHISALLCSKLDGAALTTIASDDDSLMASGRCHSITIQSVQQWRPSATSSQVRVRATESSLNVEGAPSAAGVVNARRQTASGGTSVGQHYRRYEPPPFDVRFLQCMQTNQPVDNSK
jgi:hypothetical protein